MSIVLTGIVSDLITERRASVHKLIQIHVAKRKSLNDCIECHQVCKLYVFFGNASLTLVPIHQLTCSFM